MTGRWIAGLVFVALLAAIGVWWNWRAGTTAADADGAPSATSTPGAADPIQEYTQFAATLDATNPGVEQLVEGLRALAAAVGSATGGEATALIDLRIAAEHIQLNPEDPATTANVRSSLIAAADAIADTGLRSAAESIDPRSTVAEQRQGIAEALRRAGEALASRSSGPGRD